MSKIQKLPEKVLEAITPYLVTGETIEKALLQDNKKPREIWLIKTNQAIIFHGQQPDKPQPAIMVLALDEIPEIDYLQKIDDIQLIIYSNKNNGKAVFHFETSASKEIEKFFEDLGDLITFRYQNTKGKITVVQKALPIGHKERKVFGRGKPQEVPFISKKHNDLKSTSTPKETKSIESTSASNPVVKSSVKSEPTKTVVTSAENKEKQVLKTNEIRVQTEVKATKSAISESQTKNKATESEKPANNTEKASVLPKTTEVKKIEAKQEKKPVSSSSSIISQLQENPVPKVEQVKENKSKKEIDYGNPLFFITVTVLATIVGFFCLSFFKMISRVVNYFKRG